MIKSLTLLAVFACCLPVVADEPPAQQPEPAGATAKSPTKRDLLHGPVLKPITAPSAEKIEQSIEKGIAFLLKVQNADGSWGSPHRTKGLNIYAPVPGAHHAFQTAVTALCISALIETEDGRDDIKQAVDRGEQWIFDNLEKLRRADATAIYNVWGHGYSVQALAKMYARVPDDAKRRTRIFELIESQYDLLDRYESVDGGWGYYDFRYGTKKPTSDSISFVSAALLVAFREAQDVGAHPPSALTKRAIDSIERQQKSDYSYLYGEYLKWRPMRGINRPGGSLGRSQACNLALRLWGDETITEEVLKAWLDRLFTRNGWLDIGRKRPIPHESWFQVAGYFYYFGHYYGALCIHQLPLADRPIYQAHLAKLMLDRQEKDGSWWDYPLYNYHQQYGTAFVLMTLKRCRVED